MCVLFFTPYNKVAEEGSSRRLGVGAHAICEQAEGSGLVHSGNEDFDRPERGPLVPMGRLLRRWSPPLMAMHSVKMRVKRCKLEQKRFMLFTREKLFPHEGIQAVKQVMQRYSTASLLVGFQDPTA